MHGDAAITLPERFELDREIGCGGMATVYRAHDVHLGRFVAIKVLSADLSTAVDAERFRREVAVTAKLVHPGIVALFDSGIADGRLYYVMPLVTGETLRARLVREHRLEAQDAAALAADVAEALAYAHGMGIIHRDVKPENIFTAGGRAVLADFGIARLTGEAQAGVSPATAALTTSGLALGTIAYMSPEQATGEAHIDGRSDLYSLGCVLYELLTGVPPFVAPTAMAVIGKMLTELPVPVRDSGVMVSEELDALIIRLLAKSPADRPAGAGDIVRVLRTAAHSNPAALSAPVAATRAGTPPMSEADHLVIEGLRAFNQFGPTGGAASRSKLDESKAYLTRALALDPRNARGLCALGNWYYVAGMAGITPRDESLAKGRELVFSALAADDQCAEVHCSMGKIALFHDDDFHAAERHIRRAVALDPNEPEALRLMSIVYKILGRADDAVNAARAATDRQSESAPLWNALGDSLLAAGRNAEAVGALKRAISLLPGYGPALERLELARRRLGELDLALEIRSSRLRLAGRRDRAATLDREAGELGAAEALQRDVRRELESLLERAARSDPFDDHIRRNTGDRIVSGHAELGEWAQAMDWVEREYEWRPGRLRRMLADLPVDYRGLAVDPRYARLMRVAGMEDLI
jgi:serine/threonine protein kinase/tetratricopeptide (TPR) repeat protein